LTTERGKMTPGEKPKDGKKNCISGKKGGRLQESGEGKQHIPPYNPCVRGLRLEKPFAENKGN